MTYEARSFSFVRRASVIDACAPVSVSDLPSNTEMPFVFRIPMKPKSCPIWPPVPSLNALPSASSDSEVITEPASALFSESS